jgi:hypothetical protein
VIEPGTPRELDDEQVSRAIRAMEREFPRWRRPSLHDMAFVVAILTAASSAAVLVPRLVDTYAAAWTARPF